MQVKFGTDGWRAVIADTFTFENLRIASEAAADYFLQHTNSQNGVCVGYDTRFMSEEFAGYTAGILSSRGLRVFLSDTFIPSPAVSLFCRENMLAGGIMITASHNPPVYNGFKIKASYGGSALPDTIRTIEKNLVTAENRPAGKPRKELIEKACIRKAYIDYVSRHLDLDTIKKADIQVAHNAMYGAGQHMVSDLLGGTAVTNYHCNVNPSFEGINPEPIPRYIDDFTAWFKTLQTDAAIITDGDADRVGMLDEKGSFIDPHKIFSIILRYLAEEKMIAGDVAKTNALTDIIDKICANNNLTLHTLPIGFKHVSKLMTTNDIIMGGEESGGIGVTSYLPERDGIFIGVLILEIMAAKKRSLSELVTELFDEYGSFYYDRIDLDTDENRKQAIIAKAGKGDLSTVADYRVTGFSDLDGYKYHFEGGWLLIRPSGTEPVLRLYCEADSPEKVQKALRFAALLG